MIMCLLELSVLSMRPPVPFRCSSIVLFHLSFILMTGEMLLHKMLIYVCNANTHLQKQAQYSQNSAHECGFFLRTAGFICC